MGPTQPLVQEIWGLFPGVKRPEYGVNHPTPTNAEAKEKVELYYYPPLGLHGLFYDEVYFYL